MKTKAKKKGFMDGYKKYDPSKDGYGSPDDWRNCFFERMGFEKAIEVLGADDPLVLFGLNSTATWDDVQKAYRTLSRQWHPDLNKSDDAAERMKKINAAFEVLERRYGKA